MYKDQLRNLVKPASACVDIFIALQNGTMAKPWMGHLSGTPYARSSSVESIKRWYKSRGARDVHVTMISDADRNSMAARLRKSLSIDKRFKGVDPQRLIKQVDKYDRFHRHTNMFYLRHKALTMALDWARCVTGPVR